MVCLLLLPPLLECQVIYPCLVDRMVFCLHGLFQGKRGLSVLRKLYIIIHPLESCVDCLVCLYWIHQGLPERLKVRHSDIPVPLCVVIHEALDGEAVELHVPLFFCLEVGFLYRRYEIFLESDVYVLIKVVNSPRLLVDCVCVGSCRCWVADPIFCVWALLRRYCVGRSGHVHIHFLIHGYSNFPIAPPSPQSL